MKNSSTFAYKKPSEVNEAQSGVSITWSGRGVALALVPQSWSTCTKPERPRPFFDCLWMIYPPKSEHKSWNLCIYGGTVLSY